MRLSLPLLFSAREFTGTICGHCQHPHPPNEGIVEADRDRFRSSAGNPDLGPVKGFCTDWSPLSDRPGLFPEDIDTSDPWQFRNVLVR